MGTVQSVEKRADTHVIIETKLNLSKTPIGASICCSGVCLTVVDKGPHWFAVDISQETMERSGADRWISGVKVNLEPSLKLGEEISGHFVFGHVDGQVEVKDIRVAGGSHILHLVFIRQEEKGNVQVSSGYGADLVNLVATKGSVTLDGVSLTVNEVYKGGFTVNIIPHTWNNTTLGLLKAGDKVNLEIDMLARYVARALETSQMEDAA